MRRVHIRRVASMLVPLAVACSAEESGETREKSATAGSTSTSQGAGGQGVGGSTTPGVTSTGPAASATSGGQAPVLPRLQVDLLDWVKKSIAALPGKDSEGFEDPDEATRQRFRLAAKALKLGQLKQAQAEAAQLDYQLVEMVDTQSSGPFFHALLPNGWSETSTSGGSGRGIFFVRKMADTNKPIALSSPHPRFDLQSGLVATNAFRQLDARSLAIAGTHRCANINESGCSGTTTVCGYSTYRESDMAHTARSFFQVFHEVMDSDQAGSIVHVQVHGFSSQPTDPEFTLSAGTSKDYSDPLFFPNRLASILAPKVAEKGSTKGGNSCNQPGDINRLCASTNTQGRYTNGVDTRLVCSTSSQGQAGGRFLHAELSKAMRDPKGSIGHQPFIDSLLEAL